MRASKPHAPSLTYIYTQMNLYTFSDMNIQGLYIYIYIYRP